MKVAVVMLAWVVWVTWLPTRARAQSGTEVSSIIVLVHPDVPTLLRLPDEIEDVWSIGPRVVMVKGVGSTLHLRPQPGTPADAEMFIEVKTRTLHRMFLLRVVERADDAAQEIVVPAPAAAECADAAPGSSSVAPAPVAVPRLERDPVPAETEPVNPAPATKAASERAGRDTSRFALSVHGIAALGTTAIHIAGYSPSDARRSHHALGARVAVHPYNTWWAIEANVTWESLVAPTTHTPVDNPRDPIIEVHGPRLRADAGLRGRFGTTWMATVYTGIGLQAHHLDIEAIADPEDPMSNEGSGDLPFEGVLALGMGLEYHTDNVLLGLDLHIRQGVPAEYRSVSGVVSVGFFLDQGE